MNDLEPTTKETNREPERSGAVDVSKKSTARSVFNWKELEI